jgi:hypothetical protein
MLHKLLQFINAKMDEYSQNSGITLGECPIIGEQSTPNHYTATLYIWDDTFHNAKLVASWFNEFDIDDLSIIQTLYDANQMLDEDEFEENERKWDVYFSLPV